VGIGDTGARGGSRLIGEAFLSFFPDIDADLMEGWAKFETEPQGSGSTYNILHYIILRFTAGTSMLFHASQWYT
jgi:hypothetical protein